MTDQPTTKNIKSSYGEDRMKLWGIDPEIHVGTIDRLPGEANSKTTHPQVWSDKRGQLCIGVLDLNGEFITYDSAKAKSKFSAEPFYIYRTLNPSGGNKYFPITSGQGVFPMIPVQLIQKYKSKTKIKKLVITEGYGKAIVGANFGLDIVGIPGITVWKPRGHKKLFQWILDIIEVCEVEELIWLTDGDTMTIKWKPNKDLSKRRNHFRKSVEFFKTLCKDLNLDLYYKHIKEDADGKGIDDLLLPMTEVKRKKVIKDLLRTNTTESKYFEFFNVSTSSYQDIKIYFRLDDVESFWKQNEDELTDKEFVYNRGIYRYDPDIGSSGTVITVRNGLSAPFVIVGGNIYKLGGKPTPDGRSEPTMVTVKKDWFWKEMPANIEKPRKFAETVLKDVPYYHGFLCEPSHTNYQSRFEGIDPFGNKLQWYNSYKQVWWNLREGDYRYSMQMIKHTFGTHKVKYKGKEIDAWELGLDYMQLLWQRPKQILPILVLSSKERGTGKTKFLEWCRAIFQQNVRLVSKEQLTSRFTSFFADKLLTQIEETKIDKKEMMEKIKALSTSNTIPSEGKGRDAVEGRSYLKIQLTTNNTDTFAMIDMEEVRFWVRELKPIKAEDRILDIIDKLTKEIPFFLHFLSKRALVTDNDYRSYFSPRTIETEALQKVKTNSKWKLEKDIEEHFRNHFALTKQHTLKYGVKDLIEEMNLPQNIRPTDVNNVVENKWGKSKKKTPGKFQVYSVDKTGETVEALDRKTRFWTFYASDYFDVIDLMDFLSPNQFLELEKGLQDAGEPTIYDPKFQRLPEVLQWLFPDIKVILEREADRKSFVVKFKKAIDKSNSFREVQEALFPNPIL